ncbi:MAG: hypothetical protein HOA17_01325 [Candidatus Melainabacteria bacterium]|jgi:hypothetical protein|nr:hypothetical protein [Candidatus Melainabacteria bacterium]
MSDFTLINQPQTTRDVEKFKSLVDKYRLVQHGGIYVVDAAQTIAAGATSYRKKDDKLALAGQDTRHLEQRMSITKLSKADLEILPPDLLASKQKQARAFDTLLDATLKDLRLSNDLDEKKLESLIRICKNPDFDFNADIPGLEESPLTMIMALSYEDPDLIENRRYQPSLPDTSSIKDALKNTSLNPYLSRWGLYRPNMGHTFFVIIPAFFHNHVKHGQNHFSWTRLEKLRFSACP